MGKRPRGRAVLESQDSEQIDDVDCDSDFVLVHRRRRRGAGFKAVAEQKARVGDGRVWGPLAVHPKKVTEVETWLNDIQRNGRRKLLLLSGPPGVGKSACLRALVERKGMALVEWVHPVADGSLLETIQAMRVFLKQAQSPCVTQLDQGRRKVVLVDDIPLLRFGSRAEDEMRQFWEDCGSVTGCVAVIWISSNARDLLKDDMVTDTILFRHVASTMMRKVLEAAAASWSPRKLSRDVIDAISLSSNGDIRAALLSLEFQCVTKSSSGENSSEKVIDDGTAVPGIGKDMPIEAVRGVSKILYGKKKEGSNDAFKDVPESIVESSMLEPATMVSFLFQNYIEFFGDLDDLVKASGYLSDGDLLCVWRQDFMSYQNLAECGSACVASRGLMISNLHRTPNAFRPIKGPEMKEVQEKATRSIGLVRQSGVIPELRRSALVESSGFSLFSSLQNSEDKELVPIELREDAIMDWEN